MEFQDGKQKLFPISLTIYTQHLPFLIVRGIKPGSRLRYPPKLPLLLKNVCASTKKKQVKKVCF